MNHLSLFSGIGGFDIAAGWAGMTTVGFVERDAFCQKVLAKHWPNVPIFGDIHDVTGELVRERCGDVDIITGGFPCQPFSRNGKRQATADERNLWPEMFRVVRECRPRYVIGENVEGLLDEVFDTCINDLAGEGYETRPYLYGANAFGAAHQRNRVFIVAHDSRQRVQGVRPQGEQFSHALAQSLLSLRNGDGQWQVEPDFRRAAHGLPGGVDRHRAKRLKALGNAVVPQQVLPIFMAIAEIEGVHQ